MIKLSGISKAFGDQVLFEELSFNVNRRERVGLVGRNGHGKTTLFKIILGEVHMDRGQVMIPKRYRIGYLSQHLRFTEPTVRAETCLGLPADSRHETWKAEKILAGLGFDEETMDGPPAQLSGGYQVRLNLAKCLVSEPDLLLLDEPTNYLDVVSIRWLSRFLRSWPAELILITHDRSFMDQVVTHTVGIHRRRAKKIEGNTEKLYAQILQEEEIYEKTRINDEKKRREVERFIERFRAKNTLATRVQSRIKTLAKQERLEKLERIHTLDFSFNSAPFPGKVMMRAENLSFGYEPEKPLFDGLSFEIRSNDRICVIGQNGKGKSTLLRLLFGALTPDRGTLQSHPRLDTGYFAQTNIGTLNPDRTVVEEIMSADPAALPQTARNVAGSMMFEGDNALKRISVISGGEKSRVMLGKLLVSPSNLLLLDEPTNHLDMDSCDSLLAAVDAFEGAVVMVTHEEMFLHSLATRFIVFDRGVACVFEGTYRDFLERVGWELDENFSVNQSAGRTHDIVDKKALRRKRARLLKERADNITPLERQVADLESRITSLEAAAEETMHTLHDASVSGDGDRIAHSSREHARLEEQIERLFAELEAATANLERQRDEFERRMKDLDR